ncbi:triple tyrosine motif-containing protein [Bacteroides sp. 519]|uniref:triple tyrosine motif-containing protein n=1 Tax=Bacteroides sp. 519 TaxID=2302937 RepID=UPI001EF1A660|nr:triple tyrosine motif-containing protein [Bacteroides sp. 519]
MHKVKCPDGVIYSTIINNKFYATSFRGVYFLNGDSFTLLPNTASATKTKTVGIFPFEEKLLIVSALDGIFLYDGMSTTQFYSTTDSFLENNQLLCSAMKDSLLALGSVQDGILLLNMKNGETEKISIKNGLQNKTVLSMFFDRENNLWLGLDNGIDCIHLNLPMFALLSNKSTIGSGYTSLFYKNKLYLGTNQGLYATDYPIKLTEETNLKFIQGTEGQVWSLLEYDNKIFCGGVNALIVYDGINGYKIKGIRGIWALSTSKQHPEYIIAGTYFGLYILKKVGDEWVMSHRVANANYPAKNMYIEEVTGAIWITNKEKGLFRLTLSDDLKTAQVKNYNNSSLPAGDNTYITQINDEIIIASRQGLFRYNQIKDKLERHEILENTLEGSVPYTYITQDAKNNIWYASNGTLKFVHYQPETGTWKRNQSESYLRDYLIEDFEHVAVYGQNDALIGTEEGFCLLDFSKNIRKEYPLNLQIRKVYLTLRKDSLVYGRNYTYDNSPLIIPYTNNSIKIEYSLNNYAQLFVTQYSYKLSGSGYSEWSEFSENNIKEYTNLPEGKYTFHVKTSIAEDMEEITASFNFEVLPPWYRSWYAYAIYTLAIILAILYLYYKFIVGQQKTIRKKEMEIIKQKEENTKKDEKIVSLKEKNLQAELKHKSDELIRTTLNIVRKNEMLQNIKKEAVSISRSIDDENLPNIRRKVIRLINSVDTNLEHDDDLQAFQTTFDSVHHDFFEKLDKQFPELNKKEKLLCAYIRMDLMSKEIAPLMNISLRGVEISRYRLRKKLQLSQEDNLAEFLQRL